MRKPCKGRCTLIPFLCAIILVTMGLVFTVNQTIVTFVYDRLHTESMLVKGSGAYKIWTSKLRNTFKIYLFHVENPEDILQGDLPKIIERGPYVYDMYIEKEVIKMDEDEDEIHYNLKKTFYFNAKKSGNMSINDEVTILNIAYISTINTLAGFPPMFMSQYGNNVAKLFPDPKAVFTHGKVKDILFEGLSIKCDAEKYPEMEIICMTLGTKKPPIMWDTETENVYMYSFFGTMNGSSSGPFTMKRGAKDFRERGNVTSINNKRARKIWSTKECNTIMGSDSMTWAPMDERLPRLYIYIMDTCRYMFVEYAKDVSMHGITAWRYELTSKVWDLEEFECYCPLVKKEPQCLQRGLLEISKCVEAPVITSEPHFFHGDPDLLNYVPDLKPKENLHQTYIVLDPLTGLPLSGHKKLQLNLKVANVGVDLLANVSEGYFPIVWMDEGDDTISDELLDIIYKSYRALSLARVAQWSPILIGLGILLAILLCCEIPKKKTHVVNPMVHSILMPPDMRLSRIRRLKRRTRDHPTNK